MNKHFSWIIASVNIPMMIVNLYQAFTVNSKYEPYWSFFWFCFGVGVFFITGMIPRILIWRKK